MKSSKFNVWLSVFDGDAPPGDAPPGDAPPSDAPPSDAPPSDSFNPEQQKIVNSLLAKERRQTQEQFRKSLEEAQGLAEKANITREERDKLSARLETMRSELLTKEERAKEEAAKLVQSHTKELTTVAKERDDWQNRYTESVINSEIVNACARKDTAAFETSQVSAILRPMTHLVEELDSQNEPTGRLVPRVKLEEKDKDGNPVELQLPIPDAVSRLADSEQHANLFRSNAVGGAGMFKSKSKGGETDLRTVAANSAEYRKARKDGRIKFN